jgi:predicted O-linked N-acetylglucosamine transferase (SPINDLY family)
MATSLDQSIQQAMELLRAGRLGEAEAAARRVLQNSPDSGPANYCLGLIAQRVGKHAEAVGLVRRAIASLPDVAEFFYNLSISLSAIGDVPAAKSALREATRIQPQFVEAHTNLGALLTLSGDLNAAVLSFKEAVRLRPTDPLRRLNLGKTLRSLDRLDEAEAVFRQALDIAPPLAPAWNMLGSCLREMGRITESVGAFEKATQLDPQFREAHSNLCYALYFDPTASGGRILEAHQTWAVHFANVGRLAEPSVDLSPDRRLRVGYVSPNFRAHAVGSFVAPIFEHHDCTQFEVISYSDTPNPDHVTGQLRRNSDLWRETRGLNDQALADLVRNDRVDVVVDLTLHMRGSRLGAFARRPAPVQLTHLAYCGTSGLAQMDGCVTDVHMATEEGQGYFAEPLLPLPRTYWAYRPPTATRKVASLPARCNGYVTFGSLNSLAKVNDRVVATWARILISVPNSRLALFIPRIEFNPSVMARLHRLGIPSARIDPYPRQPLPAYFETYNRIDVALDPFPYNGGTTTLDALWMGVPVVTLAGKLPVGRSGVSILRNVGLAELISESADDYVEVAVRLASDLPRLESLRGALRSRMLASPLLDAPGYVGELESLYRAAWRRWVKR